METNENDIELGSDIDLWYIDIWFMHQRMHYLGSSSLLLVLSNFIVLLMVSHFGSKL